ncbi:MAG: radical SAM protein [Candidatus Omnitrophica bacterium]|nr:radical SAM protein [Candidatus Omnitrophota bacterium]MBU1925223.1 radical SAM protein [Candidatus Omnitrophota bacterium]
MKIVLVNLPWKKGNRWGVRAGSRWPHIKDYIEDDYLPFPFYLAYAAALLKENGFEVKIIDAIAEKLPYKKFFQDVASLEPDLLVAETSTVTLKHDLEILSYFENKFSIALCGPDVHIADSDFLKQINNITFTLYGEYEATLLELAKALKQKASLNNIAGIIYRDNGSIVKNKARPLISDLDWLPWPERGQLPMKKYHDAPGGIPSPCASMWASRGCPFHCSFCLWPQVMYAGNSYRTRIVKCVVDEIEYLIKKMGFKSIYFDDDTWNIGRGRIILFCEELMRRGLKIPWAIMARAELMDEELLEIMHSSGLYAVKYGIESASQHLLNNIEKGTNLEKVEDIVKHTKFLGIKTHLTFTFGLPGETKDTVHKTIKYAIKLNPTSVQFSLATPFPGTRFFEQLDRQGHILTKDWEKYYGNRCSVIKTENLSAEYLQKAKKNAYLEWDKFCYLKNKKVAKIEGTLRERFLYSLHFFGIKRTGLKVLRYILKLMFFLPLKLMYCFGRKLCMQEESIGDRDLQLVFDAGHVKLFWKKREISKGVGLTTSFYYDDNWHDSSQGDWKLQKESKNKIGIKLKWANVPMQQDWKISIEGDVVTWSICMQIKKNVQILECKAGIMVQDAYNIWKDDLGVGRFPKITGWEEIELYNSDSLILETMSDDLAGKDRLPELELKLEEKLGSNIYPQLQNTSSRINARILQMRRLRVDQFLPGNYLNFNLEIKIKENKPDTQSISNYKKRIPFRFFKEKIKANGFLSVALKVFKHLRPVKLKNYYLDAMGIIDGTYAYKGPAFAQIDLTNNCNNNCIACWCNSLLLGDKRIKDNVKNQTLPFEVVKQTVDQLAQIGTQEIYFSGGGEPFMHPKILEVLEYVKRKGLRCYVNTNFTLVLEDAVKKLSEIKVDNFVVSVWAGTAQTYAATHPNKSEGMFYQIKGMLTLLNALKQENTKVNIYNVISNKNYHELEEMIKFAIDTNSDSLEFTVIDTIPDGTDSLLLNKKQQAEVLESCKKIKERLAGDLKGRIEILQLEQFIRRVGNLGAENANYDDGILDEMPCYVGWLFTRILADGNVNFCLKAHRIPVGNIYAQDFSSIWNGKKEQEFRRRALCAHKDDAFFSFIGNDPKKKVGCYKSCDDLARNINMHKKIQSLTSLEFYFLRCLLLIAKIRRFIRHKKNDGGVSGGIEGIKSTIERKMQQHDLQIILHREGIKMFWAGEEFTQSVGLNASVNIFGLWHDSSKARWEIERDAANEFIIRNVWHNIPIAQKWHIKLGKDGNILWEITLFAQSKIEIEESKVSIMLSPAYKKWRVGEEKGKFLSAMDWEDSKIHNSTTKSVCIEKIKYKEGYLPHICFNFKKEPGDIYPQIQNSDRIIDSRIISARRVEENRAKIFLPGEYRFFSGEIIVEGHND